MKTYSVIYTENGKEETRIFEAANPAKAFYLCKLKHPKGKLIKCYKEGWFTYLGSDRGYTEWPAPKNQDLPTLKRNRNDQLTMDELLKESLAPNPNWKSKP